ncbi:hypothetical protein [Pseudomonas mosselii]|uniref:hypothetical protein n=1 Tax=Pseudomonas mosselii TaxID=78327 RepID=UPI0021D8E0E6|nr:hypothetical protein [Pseudomonas mosselii]MCU9528360.1 hypothetical protein [Pseudomonas mosselii]MCU9535533.1 hypothetical protein [Pseudomonas mosselii]MCU9547384.1 hypothetical protein [Pseudomonas mosselii]
MFATMISSLAPAIALTSALNVGGEAAKDAYAFLPAPELESAATEAPKQGSEAEQPVLSKYLSPSAMNSLCNSLVKVFARDGSTPEVAAGLRQCVIAPSPTPEISHGDLKTKAMF